MTDAELLAAIERLRPDCAGTHARVLEPLTANLGTIAEKVGAIAATVAESQADMRHIAEDMRTRTDVLFAETKEQWHHLDSLRQDMAVIKNQRLSPRVGVLESWQAKLIGAAAGILLIANLAMSIYRAFE